MNTQARPAIGKIVKSNAHVDYVCQVYGRGEVKQTPSPDDYAFGTFVAIQPESAAPYGELVGVVYNTLLVNPDFGSLGPRLSARTELEVFSPDYLAETATLVGILVLGWVEQGGGAAHQGVPAMAATVNCPVYRLTGEELRRFHMDGGGRLCLHYAPLILAQRDPVIQQLMMNIVDRLAALFPDQQRRLAVMRNNLAWRSIVQSAG